MLLSINNNVLAATIGRNINTIYTRLGLSTRRLSSGLRINYAADDAAGLAVREMMRAQVASLNQGVRNANDAISLIQTADGALQVIDEKLIRMKELAAQASTGTYNPTQRAIINAEYVAMADEINRIAKSTSFNGIKLLDGSLSGGHAGYDLLSTGALKVHFGPGNDSAEDYYYLDIAGATIGGLGLGLASGTSGAVADLSSKLVNGGPLRSFSSGIVSFAIVPAGTTNLYIAMDAITLNDSIQIFTTSGSQLVGTNLAWNGGTNVWQINGVTSDADMNSQVLTAANGFLPGATYNTSLLNGTGDNIPLSSFTPGMAGNTFNLNGMNFGYSGDGNPSSSGANGYEYLTIDNVTQDLVFLVVGNGSFYMRASWDAMPASTIGSEMSDQVRTIETQELAQQALDDISDAIVAKDNIRAYLGAMQNRLENTVSHLRIQSENLLASESRISDVDVAAEMTEFTRNDVMLHASVSMLSQANSIPRELLKLIG